MWTEMMVAMMIPSAAPMILTFAAVQRKRRDRETPFVPTGIFLLGYLAAWTGFSVLAAIAQWILHAEALLSPMMVGTSPILGGALLLAAGVFQWTGLKHSCLAQCRSPLNFLLSDWRDGHWGAFRMGLKHGTYCIGCCWFLMALLFVAGVMNLWWIAIIAAFVLLERVLPKSLFVGRASGVLLGAWGLWLIFHR
jgi:predicted metal-binding membrane protein